MSINDMLEQVAAHYGEEIQVRQAVEEMSELTKAICKMGRTKSSVARWNYIEELADVQIMVAQLIGLLLPEEYDHYVKMTRMKLERQLERIKHEGE